MQGCQVFILLQGQNNYFASVNKRSVNKRSTKKLYNGRVKFTNISILAVYLQIYETSGEVSTIILFEYLPAANIIIRMKIIIINFFFPPYEQTRSQGAEEDWTIKQIKERIFLAHLI